MKGNIIREYSQASTIYMYYAGKSNPRWLNDALDTLRTNLSLAQAGLEAQNITG